MAHAILPPSSCSRWSVCPASHAMSIAYPQTGSSAAASAGTILHEHAETLLTTGEMPEGLSKEDSNLLSAYKQCVVERQLSLGENTTLHVEATLEYPGWNEHVWGTADVVLVSEDGETLEILDLKTGGVGVKAERNLQLICYAILAVGFYKLNPRNINLSIFQPRARDDQGPLRTWSLSFEELVGYRADINHAANLAISPEGATIYRPGASQCEWCPGAGNCEAQARSSAIADFFEGPPPVFALSDEHMAEMMANLKEVKQFMTALEKAATQRLVEGADLPGLELQPKKTQRKWGDPEEVLEVLEQSGLDEELYIERKLRSFTQVLKVPACAELVEDLVIKPEGELIATLK